MKAPDKIYYDKLCINPSGYEEGRAYELNPDPLPCVEYIRKDALLEWAKDEHDSGPIKDSADNGDAWSIGYLCGMADIIMKLNSL